MLFVSSEKFNLFVEAMPLAYLQFYNYACNSIKMKNNEFTKEEERFGQKIDRCGNGTTTTTTTK